MHFNKRLALFLFLNLMFVNRGMTQMKIPGESQRVINELQKFTESQDAWFVNKLRKKYPVSEYRGEIYLAFMAGVEHDFSPSNLPESYLFGSRSGNVISIRIPLRELSQVSQLSHVKYLEVSQRIRPHLDRAILDTRVDSVHRGDHLPMPFTGKNVIIGVTDWGFDYTHPMFYDSTLSHTRILASWDQSRNSGPPPAAFSYGTEIVGESDLLSYQSDSATFFYGMATHGSHVAGIAGGGGAGIGLYGMAPSSEFLFCQLYLDASSTLDAVSWMKDFAKQENKRLVINMSWGLYQLGPLDGTSLISQAFDALVDSGVVIVTSNGNNGDRDLHIKKTFANDTITSRVGMVVSSDPDWWGQNLIMWGSKNSSFSSGFDVYQSGNLIASTPYYNTATMTGYFDSVLVIGSDTIWYNVSQDSIHPLNQCPHMSLKVRNIYSKYAIVLKSTSSNSTVHYHNITYNLDHVANWGYDFTAIGPHGVSGDSDYTIGEPSCAKKVISVGAHLSEVRLPFDTLIGDITSFSSRGPSLDERTKPDITAPGSGIESSINSFTDESYTASRSTNFKGRSYDFAKFSGTSMSGPMVTGIVALLLEARQFATPEQIKDILKETARTDEKTGLIPPAGSNTWGWGKVNARVAIENALDVVDISEIEYKNNWVIYPNPGTNTLNIRSVKNESPMRISVFSMDGKQKISKMNVDEIDTSDLPSGLYLIQIFDKENILNFKWIKS